MGIMRFNYRSQAIGQYVDITITIPPTVSVITICPPVTRHHTPPARRSKNARLFSGHEISNGLSDTWRRR